MHYIKRVDRESPMTLLLEGFRDSRIANSTANNYQALDTAISRILENKGWPAIAKLKPNSLLISLLSMLKKAFYNVKIGK